MRGFALGLLVGAILGVLVVLLIIHLQDTTVVIEPFRV